MWWSFGHTLNTFHENHHPSLKEHAEFWNVRVKDSAWAAWLSKYVTESLKVSLMEWKRKKKSFHHYFTIFQGLTAPKNVLRKNSVTLDEDETNMTLFLFFSGAKKKEIRLEFLFHPLYLTSWVFFFKLSFVTWTHTKYMTFDRKINVIKRGIMRWVTSQWAEKGEK